MQFKIAVGGERATNSWTGFVFLQLFFYFEKLRKSELYSAPLTGPRAFRSDLLIFSLFFTLILPLILYFLLFLSFGSSPGLISFLKFLVHPLCTSAQRRSVCTTGFQVISQLILMLIFSLMFSSWFTEWFCKCLQSDQTGCLYKFLVWIAGSLTSSFLRKFISRKFTKVPRQVAQLVTVGYVVQPKGDHRF